MPSEVKNLWFGHGAHFCLGYMLALEEIKTTMKVLLNLNGNLTIVRRRYPRGQSLPGYTELTVRLETMLTLYTSPILQKNL